jgi:selenocysteine lyase/cysteine desulfurase
VLRPLRELEATGRTLSLAASGADGSLDPAAVADLIGPRTRLIVVNHASNVCGTILPVREIGAMARERGIPLLVDATQTAGCLPLDLERDGIDLLAFTGHKGLCGPPGTGGLAIHDRFDVSRLPPLVRGGTGSRSEHEIHPEFLPDRFEAGTPNGVGLAGLAASVRHVLDRTVAEIRARESALVARLLGGLRVTPGVTVQGPLDAGRRTAAVSFTVAGRSPSDVTHELDERFGILSRGGLHCAPRAHRSLGTFPEGTVRLSPGPFTTEDEIDRAVAAVAKIAGGRKK